MPSYEWISAVYDKAVFAAFDTETTGIKAKEERIVEIGCYCALQCFDKSRKTDAEGSGRGKQNNR